MAEGFQMSRNSETREIMWRLQKKESLERLRDVLKRRLEYQIGKRGGDSKTDERLKKYRADTIGSLRARLDIVEASLRRLPEC